MQNYMVSEVKGMKSNTKQTKKKKVQANSYKAQLIKPKQYGS